ncbi:TPA: hypothetical protein I8008_002860 [Legionella pneumophila]|nr:hypothetical protein [Legionella pneumophila]HAT1973851.1 hypothetical protein [Legionella pneumophila]HAT2080103.1 hypothetical protein [Legionella pneumophila]HAT3973838.1 hypothetical protein [Legionella pneumophila]HAW6245492.1 hypothetical protein [Legionella pneumophila]
MVGFLDEGLLDIANNHRHNQCEVSVVGFLDEGLLAAAGYLNKAVQQFQWLDF